MRTQYLALALAMAPIPLCTGGCMLAPSTSAAAQPLDGSGNFYGSRAFHDAFVQTATDVSFTPFVFNDDTSPVSESKVNTGYQEIAAMIGPTTLAGATISVVKVARFSARPHTAHADNITSMSSTALKGFFAGNGNGNAGTLTPPTGCTTITGINTGYVAESKDPATETFQQSLSLSDEGLYTWCKGVVVIWRDTSLHAQKLDSLGHVTTVSLTGICNTTDSADVCLGKAANTSGHVAMASLLAKNASNDEPQVDMVAPSDANIRTGSFVLSADVNLIRDSSLSDMDPIWNQARDGGTGQATFATKLVGRGATSL